MIGGRVLDPSAIIDAATGRTAYTAALLRVATQHGIPVAVPAGALTLAWRDVQPEQRPLLDLMLDLPVIVIPPVDRAAAAASGAALADAGLDVGGLGLVHAVQVSRDRGGWPVVTGDVERLLAVDPQVPFESLP